MPTEQTGSTSGRKVKEKAAGAAGLGALGTKLLIGLKAAKPVLLMAVSLGIYVEIFGWMFAVGFMVLLYLHELGHVVVLKAKGVPATAPMFIPLFGAMIRMKGAPENAYDEAMIGIGGPIAGTAAAFGAVAVWQLTGSQFFEALAFVGFLLNAFNLIPMLPLDGGRVVAALHPAVWAVGLGAVLGLCVLRPNPVLFVILVLGAIELFNRIRARKRGQNLAYFQVTARQRLTVAGLYFGLLIVLGVALHATYLSTSGHHL